MHTCTEDQDLHPIDYVALKVGDREISAQGEGEMFSTLKARDGKYFVMKKGDVVELSFSDPSLTAESLKDLKIISKGYYDNL